MILYIAWHFNHLYFHFIHDSIHSLTFQSFNSLLSFHPYRLISFIISILSFSLISILNKKHTHTFTQTMKDPPSLSSSPCSACKLLRRRCSKDCIFAPYFPSTDPFRFASVHKVFGASNVNKMLQVNTNYLTLFIYVFFFTFLTHLITNAITLLAHLQISSYLFFGWEKFTWFKASIYI